MSTKSLHLLTWIFLLILLSCADAKQLASDMDSQIVGMKMACGDFSPQDIGQQVTVDNLHGLTQFVVRYTNLTYTNSQLFWLEGVLDESTSQDANLQHVHIYASTTENNTYFVGFGRDVSGQGTEYLYEVISKFKADDIVEHGTMVFELGYESKITELHYCKANILVQDLADVSILFKDGLSVELNTNLIFLNDGNLGIDKLTASVSIPRPKIYFFIYIAIFEVMSMFYSATWIGMIQRSVLIVVNIKRYMVFSIWNVLILINTTYVFLYICQVYNYSFVITGPLTPSLATLMIFGILAPLSLLILIFQPIIRRWGTQWISLIKASMIVTWVVLIGLSVSFYFLSRQILQPIYTRLVIFNPKIYLLITQIWVLPIISNFIIRTRIIPLKFKWPTIFLPFTYAFMICIGGCEEIMPSSYFPGYSTSVFLAAWASSWLCITILALQQIYGTRFCLPRKCRNKTYDKFIHSGQGQALLEEQSECCVCVNLLVEPQLDYADINPSFAGEKYELGTYLKTPCKHLFHPNCLLNYIRDDLHCPVCRQPLPLNKYLD